MFRRLLKNAEDAPKVAGDVQNHLKIANDGYYTRH